MIFVTREELNEIKKRFPYARSAMTSCGKKSKRKKRLIEEDAKIIKFLEKLRSN